MGKAVGLAFADITKKAKAIEDNMAIAKKQGKDEHCVDLQTFIKYEMSAQLDILNGKTNSKKIKDKSDFRYTYASTARTTLRFLWLMDYLWHLLDILETKPELTFKKTSQEAYKIGLAPHHSWAIRKTVEVGMNAVPSREVFLERTKLRMELMPDAKKHVHNVKEHLW